MGGIHSLLYGHPADLAMDRRTPPDWNNGWWRGCHRFWDFEGEDADELEEIRKTENLQQQCTDRQDMLGTYAYGYDWFDFFSSAGYIFSAK